MQVQKGDSPRASKDLDLWQSCNKLVYLSLLNNNLNLLHYKFHDICLIERVITVSSHNTFTYVVDGWSLK
jgi:hypothetical protein